jgi:serine/threonine protein kinase
MRALIVDDEPLARLRLRTMLAEHKDVEVVGECGDAGAASRAIERENPELVFLDVQMPEVDGFGLLRSLRPVPAPLIIFVTAHAHRALEAFEVNATDYLLKPYDDERLARSMDRVRGRLNGAAGAADVGSSYEVLERLGVGAMGSVWKARDRRLQRTVALKFLPGIAAGDREIKRRFLQEARAVARLDHRNLCAIYDVEEARDGHPFLVMPCYEGETLEAKLRRGPLSVDQALDYAVQIAAGLAHAHAAGIVHRDIKPANLLVTREGVVKILDFGVARIAGASHTAAGVVVGTLAYMSPEQAAGEPVDHRADWWALGAVLYEMLAGRPAFGESFTALRLFYAIQFTDPAPITSLRPDLPGHLGSIVHRLLEKDPERRLTAAAPLIGALDPFRNSWRSSAA